MNMKNNHGYHDHFMKKLAFNQHTKQKMNLSFNNSRIDNYRMKFMYLCPPIEKSLIHTSNLVDVEKSAV